MTNKQFAEKNAGKYFVCPGGYKARVVGYYKGNDRSILVSVSPRVHNVGWSKGAMGGYDVFVIRSIVSAYRYFNESDLEEWK